MKSAALLSALHGACFPEGWGVDSCRDVLEMPGTIMWVAVREEVPAGFLVVRQVLDEAEVISTGVLPLARRTGVAALLFSTANTDLVDCQRMFLEVSEHNQPARRLYESLGFQQSGRRAGYYADGSDAIVMIR